MINAQFFIHPSNKEEIANTISSLDKYKPVGLYSVPINILILLNYEISNPLLDLLDLSSLFVIFPSVPKIAKVVAVYKKDCKLYYQNYHHIYLLSNIEKIFEKVMDKCLIKAS